RQGPLRTALALAEAAAALALDSVEIEGEEESGNVKKCSDVQGGEQEHITKRARWAFGLPGSFLWRLPTGAQTSTKASGEPLLHRLARSEGEQRDSVLGGTGMRSSSRSVRPEGSTSPADNVASTVLSEAPADPPAGPALTSSSVLLDTPKPGSLSDHNITDGNFSATEFRVVSRPVNAPPSSAPARHPADDRTFPPLPARSFNTRTLLYRGGSSGALVRSGSYSGPSGGLLGPAPVTTAGRRSSYCAPGSASTNMSSSAASSVQTSVTSITSSVAGVGDSSGVAPRSGLPVAPSGSSIGHAPRIPSAGGGLRPSLSSSSSGGVHIAQGGGTQGRTMAGGLPFSVGGTGRGFLVSRTSGQLTQRSSGQDSEGSVAKELRGGAAARDAVKTGISDFFSSSTPVLEEGKSKSVSEASGYNRVESTTEGDRATGASDYVHLITGALIPRDEFLKPGVWRVELMVGWRQNEFKQALLAPDEGGTPALPVQTRQDCSDAEREQDHNAAGWHAGPELGWVPVLHRRSEEEAAVGAILQKLVEGTGEGQAWKAGHKRGGNTADILEDARVYEGTKSHQPGKNEGITRKERKRTASPRGSDVASCSAAYKSLLGGTRGSPAREYAFAEKSCGPFCDTIEIPSPSQRFFWLSCTTQVLNGARGILGPDGDIAAEPGATVDSSSSSTLAFSESRPDPSSSSSPPDLCAAAPTCPVSFAPDERAANPCTRNVSSESLPSLCSAPRDASRLTLGPSEALNMALLPNPPIFQRSFALARRLQSAYPELSYMAPSYHVLPSPLLFSSPGSAVPACVPGISVHPVYSEERQQAAFNDIMSRVHGRHQQIKSEHIDEVRGVWCVKPKQKQIIQDVVVAGDLLPLGDFLEHLRTPPAHSRNEQNLPSEKPVFEMPVDGPEREERKESEKRAEENGTEHGNGSVRHRSCSAGPQGDVSTSYQFQLRQTDAPDRRHSPGDGTDSGRYTGTSAESSFQTATAGLVPDLFARRSASPGAEGHVLIGSPSRPLVPEGAACLDPCQSGPTILKRMLDRAEAVCSSMEAKDTRSEEPTPARFCVLSAPEKSVKVSTEQLVESLRFVRSQGATEGGPGRGQGTRKAPGQAPTFAACNGSMHPRAHQGAGAMSSDGKTDAGNPESSRGQETQEAPGEASGGNHSRQVPGYLRSQGVRGEDVRCTPRETVTSFRGKREFISYATEWPASGIPSLLEEDGQRGGEETSNKQEQYAEKAKGDVEEQEMKGQEEFRRRVEDGFLGLSEPADRAPRLRTAKVAMELHFSPDVVRLRKLHAALADLKAAVLEAEAFLKRGRSKAEDASRCAVIGARIVSLVKSVRILQQPGLHDELKCTFTIHPDDDKETGRKQKKQTLSWQVGGLKALLGVGRGVALCPAVRLGPCATVLQVTRVRQPCPSPRTLSLANSPAALIADCSALLIRVAKCPYSSHADWLAANALPADAFLDALAPRRRAARVTQQIAKSSDAKTRTRTSAIPQKRSESAALGRRGGGATSIKRENRVPEGASQTNERRAGERVKTGCSNARGGTLGGQEDSCSHQPTAKSSVVGPGGSGHVERALSRTGSNSRERSAANDLAEQGHYRGDGQGERRHGVSPAHHGVTPVVADKPLLSAFDRRPLRHAIQPLGLMQSYPFLPFSTANNYNFRAPRLSGDNSGASAVSRSEQTLGTSLGGVEDSRMGTESGDSLLTRDMVSANDRGSYPRQRHTSEGLPSREGGEYTGHPPSVGQREGRLPHHVAEPSHVADAHDSRSHSRDQTNGPRTGMVGERPSRSGEGHGAPAPKLSRRHAGTVISGIDQLVYVGPPRFWWSGPKKSKEGNDSRPSAHDLYSRTQQDTSVPEDVYGGWRVLIRQLIPRELQVKAALAAEEEVINETARSASALVTRIARREFGLQPGGTCPHRRDEGSSFSTGGSRRVVSEWHRRRDGSSAQGSEEGEPFAQGADNFDTDNGGAAEGRSEEGEGFVISSPDDTSSALASVTLVVGDQVQRQSGESTLPYQPSPVASPFSSADLIDSPGARPPVGGMFSSSLTGTPSMGCNRRSALALDRSPSSSSQQLRPDTDDAIPGMLSVAPPPPGVSTDNSARSEEMLSIGTPAESGPSSEPLYGAHSAESHGRGLTSRRGCSRRGREDTASDDQHRTERDTLSGSANTNGSSHLLQSSFSGCGPLRRFCQHKNSARSFLASRNATETRQRRIEKKRFKKITRWARLRVPLHGSLRDVEVQSGVQQEPWPDELLLRLVNIANPSRTSSSLRDAKTGPEIRPLPPLPLPVPCVRFSKAKRDILQQQDGRGRTREQSAGILTTDESDSAETCQSQLLHDSASCGGEEEQVEGRTTTQSSSSSLGFSVPQLSPCSFTHRRGAGGSSSASPSPSFFTRPFGVGLGADGSLRVSALNIWTWHLPALPDLSPEVVASWLLKAQRFQCMRFEKSAAGSATGTQGRNPHSKVGSEKTKFSNSPLSQVENDGQAGDDDESSMDEAAEAAAAILNSLSPSRAAEAVAFAAEEVWRSRQERFEREGEQVSTAGDRQRPTAEDRRTFADALTVAAAAATSRPLIASPRREEEGDRGRGFSSDRRNQDRGPSPSQSAEGPVERDVGQAGAFEEEDDFGGEEDYEGNEFEDSEVDNAWDEEAGEETGTYMTEEDYGDYDEEEIYHNADADGEFDWELGGDGDFLPDSNGGITDAPADAGAPAGPVSVSLNRQIFTAEDNEDQSDDREISEDEHMAARRGVNSGVTATGMSRSPSGVFTRSSISANDHIAAELWMLYETLVLRECVKFLTAAHERRTKQRDGKPTPTERADEGNELDPPRFQGCSHSRGEGHGGDVEAASMLSAPASGQSPRSGAVSVIEASQTAAASGAYAQNIGTADQAHLLAKSRGGEDEQPGEASRALPAAVESPLVELPSFCCPLLYQTLYEILLTFFRYALMQCVKTAPGPTAATLLRYWPPTLADFRIALQLRLRYLHQLNVSFLFLSPFLSSIPPPRPYYPERGAESGTGVCKFRQDYDTQYTHPVGDVQENCSWTFVPVWAPPRSQSGVLEGKLAARTAWTFRFARVPLLEKRGKTRGPGGASLVNAVAVSSGSPPEDHRSQAQGSGRSGAEDRGVSGRSVCRGFSSSPLVPLSRASHDRILVALSGTKSLLLPSVKSFLFRPSTVFRMHVIRRQILHLPGYAYAFQQPELPRQIVWGHAPCLSSGGELGARALQGPPNTEESFLQKLAWTATCTLLRVHAPAEDLLPVYSRSGTSLLEVQEGNLVVNVTAPLSGAWANVGGVVLFLDRNQSRQTDDELLGRGGDSGRDQGLDREEQAGEDGERGGRFRGGGADSSASWGLPGVTRLDQSLTGQLSRQLRVIDALKLIAKERSFVVRLRGEGAQDLGGPYAEILSNVCDDLIEHHLLVECPNARNSVGNNRDMYVVNPALRDYLLGADAARFPLSASPPDNLGEDETGDGNTGDDFISEEVRRGQTSVDLLCVFGGASAGHEAAALGCLGPSSLFSASANSMRAPVVSELPPVLAQAPYQMLTNPACLVESIFAQMDSRFAFFGLGAGTDMNYRSTLLRMVNEKRKQVLPSLAAPAGVQGDASTKDGISEKFCAQCGALAPPYGALSAYGQKIASILFSIGRLMACAVITQNPLNLNLSPAFWKLLLLQIPSLGDLQAVDVLAAKQLKSFLICCDRPSDCIHMSEVEDSGLLRGFSASEDDRQRDDSVLQAFAQSGYTVDDVVGRNTELFRGGSRRIVDPGHIAETVQAAVLAKLVEGHEVAGWLAYGLYDLLPIPHVQAALTAEDLRAFVCGENEIDISVLRRFSKITWEEYDSHEEQLIENLWEVLESFTNREKQMFLRFVSGRSRLPPSWLYGNPGSGMQQPFEIHIMSDEEALEIQDVSLRSVQVAENQTVDDRLPTASTCFFMIKLPRYSSKEVLRSKLKLAIMSCVDIDLDALHHDVDFPLMD
ncbi:hect-domain (ubiquitin-transferase) domain-containing, partial [Cystoisospora suis]